MTPSFLYFDLGKVLLDFSRKRAARQVADVAGIEPDKAMEAIYLSGLQAEYERGRISGREFYEAFCRRTGTRPDYDAVKLAGSDIFELNAPMLPVVTQLRHAGYRLGLLSNTCESHWEHCLGRFRILAEMFSVYALSYRIGSLKPAPAIFRAAAELAGARPEEIFFTDDSPGHVEGARAAGFDAVQYISTPQLVTDLRTRGMQFNY